MNDIIQLIYDSQIGTWMRESETAFPLAETLHVIAITTVLGTIAVVDLRLIGYPSHRRGVRQLIRDMLPFTWAAFILAVVSGLLLFASDATSYVENGPFLAKMVLLVLAGVNMAIFHASAYRSIEAWDEASRPPVGARLAGATSLALWIGVIFAGRWVGFV